MEGKGNNVKYAPYVFTEQGIYMLSTVLKGELAISQSIMIMRTFKEIRHYFIENKSLFNELELLKLDNRMLKNERQIDLVKSDIGEMKTMVATKHELERIMDNFIDDEKIKEFII